MPGNKTQPKILLADTNVSSSMTVTSWRYTGSRLRANLPGASALLCRCIGADSTNLGRLDPVPFERSHVLAAAKAAAAFKRRVDSVQRGVFVSTAQKKKKKKRNLRHFANYGRVIFR